MIGAPALLPPARQCGPPPAPTRAPAPAPDASSVGVGTDVAWAPTLADAIERARKLPDGRVLVELWSADCAECQRQESLVIPSRWFFGFMKDKIPVRLGFTSPEGRKMAERFGIPAPPAWLVLTTDGLLSG